MAYTMKTLSCDPTKLIGLSEKLILSHYENNYGGAVKDDQQEIARISIPVKITRPANVSRFGNPAALAKGIALAQRPRNRDLADSR
jgi:hypothetical protein